MSKEHSSELNELAAALSAAQSEFVAIPKDSKNPFFNSKYAGLPKVVEVAAPILTKHGLAISQFLGHDDQGDTLTTWLLHRSGQYICEEMRLHVSAQKGLTDVQAQGSATTYSRRYSYMSVLGLVTDDDDGNAASEPRPVRSNTASVAQQDLILKKASDIPPTTLVDLMLAAVNAEPLLFATQDEALNWVERALPKFPASAVTGLLEAIDKASQEVAA